nr:Succinyl-CoA synthetase, alpha subunit-related enzymes [Kibdelosporangium sp. MJ126-NF4]
MRSWAEPGDIRWILESCQTWAIVGLADNPSRAAHGVARFLQQRGKRIVPVHPAAETVWGEQGYATLADIPFEVDCVDVFRRADEAGQFADQAVKIGSQAVWFQLGVVDQAAFERATKAGLRMVMDRCPAIEWPRHGATAGN